MRRVVLVGLVALAAMFSVPGRAKACDPPPGTTCTRQIWLSLQVEKTGVLADGQICLEIGVLSRVFWDLGPPCPQPTAMRIRLTLKDGNTVVAGPDVIDLPTPTVPGLQFSTDRVQFKVDGTKLPKGQPFLGIVCGTLEVDWALGPAPT